MTIQEFATAIQTQIALAAGLTGDKVIWEMPGHTTQSSVPRPARPFISLSIQEDGNVEPLPEEEIIDNPSPDPPIPPFPSQTPILLQTTDRPEIVVRLVAFHAGPRIGAVSPAFALLKKVRGKLGSELFAAALDPITVLDRGNVTDADLMLETAYEGRAVLDLKFGSIETESEGLNTIETVKTQITIKRADNSVIIDKEITLPNS